MKEDNNIEDLFRSSFDHFEVAPPPVVKEEIDRKIGGSSNKRIWWISALVLLLGAASLLYFFTDSSEAQGAGSADKQLATTETNPNSSRSTTKQRTNNSSTNQTSTSSANHSNDKNTVSSATNELNKQTKKRATENPNLSSSKSNDKEVKTNSINKKTRSAKAKTSKRKGTSGKKTSGKKAKNNAGTPGFNDLSGLNLTDVALNNSGDGTNDPDNPSNNANGDGSTDPANPTDTNGSGSLNSNPPKETDSIPAKTNEPPVTQASDSAKNDGSKPKPPKNKTTGNNWLASVYAGPSFGINSKSNDDLRSVSEKPSFQFSAEINRTMFAGYGLSTGFGFNQRQETFKRTTQQILDSAIVVNDSIPIYQNPQQPDTIIGWIDTTYYFDDTLSTDYTQVNRIQTIGIPLYFNKHFSFSDKWGLLVNAGAVFQFYKVSQGELNGMPAPTVNDFSLNIAGRFHATYTWNQWMFSAGVSTGWEMKQALIYEGLDRKRYFITPQLGFHFRF